MPTHLAKSETLAVRSERALIKQIAMDIGKQVAFHIETMYPEAVAAASSTFLLSVRNCTHNAIMCAIESEFSGEQQIERNDKHRRLIRRLKKMGDQCQQP